MSGSFKLLLLVLVTVDHADLATIDLELSYNLLSIEMGCTTVAGTGENLTSVTIMKDSQIFLEYAIGQEASKYHAHRSEKLQGFTI